MRQGGAFRQPGGAQNQFGEYYNSARRSPRNPATLEKKIFWTELWSLWELALILPKITNSIVRFLGT